MQLGDGGLSVAIRNLSRGGTGNWASAIRCALPGQGPFQLSAGGRCEPADQSDAKRYGASGLHWPSASKSVSATRQYEAVRFPSPALIRRRTSAVIGMPTAVMGIPKTYE